MTVGGRGPAVRYPPPLLFLAGLIGGWALDRFVRPLWWPASPGVARVAMILGWVLLVAGLGLAFWGRATFARAGTTVNPTRDATMLVLGGPYRFTRNPMYLGLTIAYIGGALVLKALWPLVLLPVVLFVLHATVIRREERYLSAAFGGSYLDYQRRVGRWIGF